MDAHGLQMPTGKSVVRVNISVVILDAVHWKRNIQLMHSFEVDIRICQPETRRSRGEYHFRGLTNPDVNRKRMHQYCFVI